MQYTIGDVLMIIGYVGALIATYVVITNRITKLEVKHASFTESAADKLSSIRSDVRNNKSEIDQEKRFVLQKLALLESGQSKTNIFLEENLKRLTEILSKQDSRIGDMEKQLSDHNRELTQFYREFESKKKT